MINNKITHVRFLSGDDVCCFFHDTITHELSLLVTFPWITINLTQLQTLEIITWELKMTDKLIVNKNYENKLLKFWNKINLITFNTFGTVVEQSRFAEHNITLTGLKLKQDDLFVGSAEKIIIRENKIYDCSNF